MAYSGPSPIIPGKKPQLKANAYVILPTDFLNSVDFTKIFGRPETLRYNTDRDKFIVKYSGHSTGSHFRFTGEDTDIYL
jgi:hypothetical protein